ncbi:hypothetical protein C4E22_05715 [ANME-1 cluster archaeon AG-394-G06]|nr:hypothetical protein [ANME-1 cluster archaeon AG-394-G06]
MKKIVGLVIVGCLLMFVLSTVAVTANSSDSEFIRGNETKTIILTNVSNSFPMFSDAEYVNFTIEDNTINLTLDLNASFDGVCNLSNLTGTNISADGSFAELKDYFLISYHRVEYDQKWKSAPYFNDTENRLYLLAGSGSITRLNIELKENATDKTIPKVVGVGDLVGHFHIKTLAHGKNSTYNDISIELLPLLYTTKNMGGVGYVDLYVQYAPDTSYEDTPFLPTFSDCEKVQAIIDSSICGSESTVDYQADNIIGVVNGAEPISGVSHDWNLSLKLDADYFPTAEEFFPTIDPQNHSVWNNQTWELSPYFDDTENRLYLLAGSGLLMSANIELKENVTDETIPKVVGVGDLVGDFHIETIAQGKNSTYNDLTSNIKGIGYADLYIQYAPDATYENVTFIPTFSQCEKLRLSANIFGSSIEYVAVVLGSGHANGVEYLEFDDVPLDSVTINETFELEYHPVNISGELFNETWSVKPEQYKDTLVILRGTGNITRLDFTFDDCNTTHPEISSYGYLRGDYNVTENILPHYMNVIVEGTNVSAMDESGQGGFGITFA